MVASTLSRLDLLLLNAPLWRLYWAVFSRITKTAFT